MMTLTSAVSSTSEVDVELFTFVERYATNLVRWDLLIFFGSYPDRKLTVAELAQQLRRTVRGLTKELDDLTYLRVLTRRYTPEKVTYQLARRRPIRRSVMRLAEYSGKWKGKQKSSS